MFQKIRKLGKKAKALMVTAAVAAVTVVPAFAEGTNPDVTSVMTTSFNSVKDQVTSGIMVALPVALGIVALTFGIKYVVRFFKSVSRG